MITLTPTQEKVLRIVSQQEGRHPSQMLSLLMDNGVDFWYCDREPTFTSPEGKINDCTGTGLWKEAENFYTPEDPTNHSYVYNGSMLPLGEEVYSSLPEYEDHPSEYYEKLLNEQT